MEKYNKIRKTMYSVQLTRWAHLINIKSPYTLIKAIYYMETASLFLFITQKIIKSPNFITFLYALTGVIGSFLLLSSQETMFYIGIFMVFTKGTFDWADGPLARRLNKTSFIGHALDEYGAYVSDAAFRLAFIYYTLRYFPELMYLFPVAAFILLITRFNLFSDSMCYKNIVDSPLKGSKKVSDNEFKEVIKDSKKDVSVVKWYYRYISFLDARARSIDFLLLLLIIDKVFVYNLSELFLILSMALVLRAVLMYVAGIYSAFKADKLGLDV
jgi:hypothetical protein